MNQAISVLIRRLAGLAPETAIVLGSGLGSLADEVDDAVRIPYAELEGFPHSGVSGHAAEVVAGRWNGTPVLLLSGRAHYYENGDASVMRGTAGNAARPRHQTADPDQRGRFAARGHAAGLGHADHRPHQLFRHQPAVRRTERPPASSASPMLMIPTCRQPNTHRGPAAPASSCTRASTCGSPGPSFETPAEIRMARTLGADAVGMSTVPEVILARFLGLRVAAASVDHQSGGRHERRRDFAPGDQGNGAARLRHARLADGPAARNDERRIGGTGMALLPQEFIRKKRDSEICSRPRTSPSSFAASPTVRSRKARSPPSPWRSISTA